MHKVKLRVKNFEINKDDEISQKLGVEKPILKVNPIRVMEGIFLLSPFWTSFTEKKKHKEDDIGKGGQTNKQTIILVAKEGSKLTAKTCINNRRLKQLLIAAVFWTLVLVSIRVITTSFFYVSDSFGHPKTIT